MNRKIRPTSTMPVAWVALLVVLATAASADHTRHAAATKRAQRAATATTPAARPKPTTPAMPRTLSDVHIEGEIPVPQVLFITARDQRRFMDFQHHRYLRSSTQLGEATPSPTWVAVTNGSPDDSRKETSR